MGSHTEVLSLIGRRKATTQTEHSTCLKRRAPPRQPDQCRPRSRTEPFVGQWSNSPQSSPPCQGSVFHFPPGYHGNPRRHLAFPNLPGVPAHPRPITAIGVRHTSGTSSAASAARVVDPSTDPMTLWYLTLH